LLGSFEKLEDCYLSKKLDRLFIWNKKCSGLDGICAKLEGEFNYYMTVYLKTTIVKFLT
jgi:hypothetical protein